VLVLASVFLCGCDFGGGDDRDELDKQITLDLGDGVTMKLVLIPAGKFMMGSSPNGLCASPLLM